MLRLGGFYPTSSTCSACGKKLEREGAHYVVDEHRLRCARCARTASNGLSLSPSTFRYLNEIWQRPPGELAAPTEKKVLTELAMLHRKLVAQQLDKDLASLQVLDDLIRLAESSTRAQAPAGRSEPVERRPWPNEE